MSIKVSLSLAAAFLAAAGAFALAQGGDRLRRSVEAESCEAAALVSAQALAANLVRCQSRALALVRIDDARAANVVATDDDEPAESATAMQGSPLMRMTPAERAHALAQRCEILRLRCDGP